MFRSSETSWWSTSNGIPVAITNVIVGSLGIYPPIANTNDLGPDIILATNFPGANQGDEKDYRADITNVFYVLVIPQIWIMPREAFACVGGSNVQYAVTGTNIPLGVTWTIIPSGVGATIQTNADWHFAGVTPGSVATNYKVRATSKDSTNFYDQVNLTVVKVVIDNYATVTYDGLNSGSLILRVEPEGVTPSSYAWSTTWPTPAYNNPQVTFESPSGESTRIMNAHWYATTTNQYTRDAAFYNIYCTVQINGMSCSNATPETFCVDVYEKGGQCAPPSCIWAEADYIETNGYFMIASVAVWGRVNAVISNAYTSNSQFYTKVQKHEQQHKDDYDNGFNGHVFFQSSEFEPMVVGLTNSTYVGLGNIFSERFNQYRASEVTEIISVINALEDRAYQVSDALPPFYVYQRGGL